MTEIYISLALIFIPAVSFFTAKRLFPQRLCAIMGVSMGLVVSPIGLGVYYLGYMIPFLGLLFIFLYAFVLSSHSAAGYEILSYFFHVKANSTALSIERLYAELINGIIWGSFYGGLGFIVDKLRRKNKKNENKPQQKNRGDRE